jgi:hypothetical protein
MDAWGLGCLATSGVNEVASPESSTRRPISIRFPTRGMTTIRAIEAQDEFGLAVPKEPTRGTLLLIRARTAASCLSRSWVGVDQSGGVLAQMRRRVSLGEHPNSAA